MHHALYEPAMGYYSAGSTKFGEAGDFTTAPETSPLFGACLGRQIGLLFQQTGMNTLLELGAGTGKLAAEVLSQLHSTKQLPKSYYILEVSADLRQRQKTTLEQMVPELVDRVVWWDSLPSNPLSVVVIANEVLDALPVERFQLDEYGVIQNLGVTWKNRFQDAMRPASGLLLNCVRKIRDGVNEPWPSGYTSEVCLGLAPWLTSVLECVQQGIVLIMDYGLTQREYYLPDRNAGTLMCYYRHRVNDDPYQFVGLQDITAWVDFSHVAQVAETVGLNVAGFTTQAHFLLSLGSEIFQQAVTQNDQKNRVEAIQQIKTLTMPGEMGERFKVMALSRDVDITMDAFLLRDFRWAL